MYQCHMLTCFQGERERILSALNVIPEVLNWRASTGAIFVVTIATVSAITVADRVRVRCPGIWFIVAPIYGSLTQGVSDKETWDFINYPKPK
jgi:hypothetical protein